jgi:hypothetical protein
VFSLLHAGKPLNILKAELGSLDKELAILRQRYTQKLGTTYIPTKMENKLVPGSDLERLILKGAIPPPKREYMSPYQRIIAAQAHYNRCELVALIDLLSNPQSELAKRKATSNIDEITDKKLSHTSTSRNDSHWQPQMHCDNAGKANISSVSESGAIDCSGTANINKHKAATLAQGGERPGHCCPPPEVTPLLVTAPLTVLVGDQGVEQHNSLEQSIIDAQPTKVQNVTYRLPATRSKQDDSEEGECTDDEDLPALAPSAAAAATATAKGAKTSTATSRDPKGEILPAQQASLEAVAIANQSPLPSDSPNASALGRNTYMGGEGRLALANTPQQFTASPAAVKRDPSVHLGGLKARVQSADVTNVSPSTTQPADISQPAGPILVKSLVAPSVAQESASFEVAVAPAAHTFGGGDDDIPFYADIMAAAMF